MNRLLKIIKPLMFCVILVLLIPPVMDVFSIGRKDISSRDFGFRKEPKGTLDAVFIGSSNVYTYFQPPLAWNDYGIAVYNYTPSALGMWSIKYRIDEARKTQKDALFLITINTFHSEEPTYTVIHRNVDYLPWGLNRIRTVTEMVNASDSDFFSGLEFYFPIIRFHPRWASLSSEDFLHPADPYKGAGSEEIYLNGIYNNADQQFDKDIRAEISEERLKILDELLDYIKAENVSVLFVRMPTFNDSAVWGELNSIEDAVIEAGFECLDFYSLMEETEFQKDTDYSDLTHANIHGSLKITDYIGRYLTEHYGFTDKRHQPGYESWDHAAEAFLTHISGMALDFEIAHAERDYSIAVSTLPTAEKTAMAGTVQLSWTAAEGADGYLIYRKSNQSETWSMTARLTGGAATEFEDKDLSDNVTYSYLVVPYTKSGGNLIYGKFRPRTVDIKI